MVVHKMIPRFIKIKQNHLPETPGVYLMKNGSSHIIYVGKAGNLRRRVTSYFTRPHDDRIQKLVSEIRRIDYRTTDTAIEALILESDLIKKYEPLFNVREKDDKSFLSVEITNESFPRVLLVRRRDPVRGRRFGPFTSASSIREAFRILRRIFPWSLHEVKNSMPSSRPCFDYQIGLCPGICIGAVGRKEYLKNIRNIQLFFEGKKKLILTSLRRDMKSASRRLDYEVAEKTRRQLFALQHIQDVALINDSDIAVGSDETPPRIEGYDISNISGTSAVGAMVVFRGVTPDKAQYRKFRIKTVVGSNDVGMFKEVLRRRFHNQWPLPDVILVDGGLAQVNAARAVLREFRLRIPVVGIAKGPERKKNDFFGSIPKVVTPEVLIKVRDEAHRFSIQYHRRLRSARMFGG